MKKVLFFLLLLPGGLWAGDVSVNGADKPVPVNSFAELSVKVEKGDAVSWIIFPQPVKKVDDGAGKLYFSGPPGSKFTVFVTVVNFEAKRLDNGQAVVPFAGTPLPNPDGGEEVEPGVEATTVLNQFRTAYNLEAEEDKPLLPKLAAMYRDSVREAGTAETWGQLFESMQELAKKAGVSGKMVIVQRAIQVELKKKLPSKGASDTPLTAAGRKKAQETFRYVADTLDKVTPKKEGGE